MKYRPLAGALAALTGVICLGSAIGAGAATLRPNVPQQGGVITLGGLATTIEDPGQVGYSLASLGMSEEWDGLLFSPPTTATGHIQPNLAAGYSYNANDTQLTITLKKGLKFSDGSPLNASALIWNWLRYDSATSTNAQYFTLVTAFKKDSNLAVTLHFSQPYTLLPSAFSATAAGQVESPSGFNSLGANQFDITPVGAGPYMIQGSTTVPDQTVTMLKNPNYWDAKHVYLAGITYKNTGTDPTAQLSDLSSNAIQVLSYSGQTGLPPLIFQALSNPNFDHNHAPATTYQFVPMNDTTAPFNNLQAREALMYCTDRQALATYTQGGYASPTYVMSGNADAYLSSWQDGEKYNPYAYNPSQGSQIVSQLGGLTFTIQEGAATPLSVALQAQWAQCGMKVTILNSSAYLSNWESGSAQALLTTFANTSYNPGLQTAYLNPNQPQGHYAINDAQVTKWLQVVNGTTNTATIQSTWVKLWKHLASQAEFIPLISGPTYEFWSKCVSGIAFTGIAYTHAYLTCPV